MSALGQNLDPLRPYLSRHFCANFPRAILARRGVAMSKDAQYVFTILVVHGVHTRILHGAQGALDVSSKRLVRVDRAAMALVQNKPSLIRRQSTSVFAGNHLPRNLCMLFPGLHDRCIKLRAFVFDSLERVFARDLKLHLRQRRCP